MLDGARGASGLRALLDTAGAHTGTASPRSVGALLRDSVGVDLLAEQPAWGLAQNGPRALVLAPGARGLSAPVANLKAARRMLAAWLAERGPARPTRPKPLKGPLVAGDRAGMIAPVAGAQRLLVATGPHAAALVLTLAHPSPMSRDAALLARARGPSWLWLAGEDPVRAAVLRIDADARGLRASGLVTSTAPLLDGAAPVACAGAPVGCLRAGLAPAGRALLSRVLRQMLGQQAGLTQATRAAVRLDEVDPRRLDDAGSLPKALRFAAAFDEPAGAQPCPAPAGVLLVSRPGCHPAPALDRAAGGPALSLDLDVARIAAALQKLSPLDALTGELAAGAYAANLLYGPLLRSAGPLAVEGAPSPAGTELTLRLPLR